MLAAEPSRRPTAAEVASQLSRTDNASPTLPLVASDSDATVAITTQPVATAEVAIRHRRKTLVITAAALAAFAIIALVASTRHGHAPAAPGPARSTETVASTPSTRPSTAQPTTAPPTTAALTFAQLIAKMEQTVTNAAAQGQITASIAVDLEHHLQDLANHQQTGAPVLAHQIADLANFVADHTNHGGISTTAAAVLDDEIGRLQAVAS